jgi:hypothetical protein
MNSLVSLSAVVAELRPDLDAQVNEDGQLVVLLPSSLDQLVLTPSQKTPHLLWQHRTFLGTATDSAGYLDWTADAVPLQRFIWAYAYSSQQMTPQYQHVMDALRGRGLDPELVPADGGGFHLYVDLKDSTFLLIAAGEDLPPRFEQVTGWHVEHYSPEDHIAVVYDSTPERSGPTAGPDVNLMADSVARYVSTTMARYGGRHPLGLPQRNRQEHTAPSTVAWLLAELAGLPRHRNELAAPGGAVFTIAERDGSEPVTVVVPAAVVGRISSLLLSEITACRTYGG